MQRHPAVVAALLIACGHDPSAGPPGPAGPQGPKGDPGEPATDSVPSAEAGAGGLAATGFRWVDRNGAPVAVVYYERWGLNDPATTLMVLDKNGYMWPTNAWGDDGLTDQKAPPLWFSGADCTGTAYFFRVRMDPPSIPFRFSNDGILRVIPPDAVFSNQTYASIRDLSGACTNGTGTASFVIPFDSTVPATPIKRPAKLFEPPLRPVPVP